ncbi:MAG: MATE family efflux transporter [Methanomassiliicoccaceae archaeon]|nr:MATE family efflux transporter [Methanomassiliicoccaceae archaeon]
MEEQEKTKDVETLLGDPKKAILAMAIPTTIALVAQSVNNLVDAMWVSGLGRDSLAAVGIVFPLFFIIIGISNGVGIGAASAISKRIGAEDKAGADRTAAHAMVLILIASVAMMALFLAFLEPIVRLIGGGASEGTIQECLSYAYPLAVFVAVFMLVGVLSSILRSEGAAKRSMYILIIAAVINLVLDPFFIYDYGLGLGMAGAALATVLAEGVALAVIIYWYFVRKDMYLRFRFRGFRFEAPIIKDIFKVGVPAAFQMMIVSVVVIFMNMILLEANGGGDDAVAIYSSGWRLLSILMIPTMGIASGIVPVCAAAYGARRYDKVKAAYNYGIKISVAFMVVVAAVTMVFAPDILMIFTYDSGTEHLRDGMTEFLRISLLFLPFVAVGAAAESLFQALGMGTRALVSTIFRNFLLVPVCYLAMVTTSGLTYIWWGSTFSEIAGCLFVAAWAVLIIRVISREFEAERKLSGT